MFIYLLLEIGIILFLLGLEIIIYLGSPIGDALSRIGMVIFAVGFAFYMINAFWLENRYQVLIKRKKGGIK